MIFKGNEIFLSSGNSPFMIKSPMIFSLRAVCVLMAVFFCIPPCRAISEGNYASTYKSAVIPFMKSGERFSFRSADGKHTLSGIRFIHPQAKGMIVIINGFSQTWLQYGELFYDLYHQGYSLLSYDHRGQGLSPHLVPFNSQIGSIDHFRKYADDLNAFMENVVHPIHPSSKGLFLIANSMGGAIAALYLEQHASPPPFSAIVLSAPMFQINTQPYPEWLARFIVGGARFVGLGRHYAIGRHDFNPEAPYADNALTHSLPRWQADREVKILHPKTVVGGPSNDWVNASLSETAKIRSQESSITVPTLIFEAGNDQLVINQAESEASSTIPHAKLVSFPESKHGILMEKDEIRDKANGRDDPIL
jgi:lysophospholipase